MRASKLLIIAIAIIFIAINTLAQNANEFEGKYQVGNTSCIVEPIKMAFEVRWAKGDGVMTFFFDTATKEGKYIYVSEEKTNGKDHFAFDNEQFASGKFIRSDGKAFLVRKIPQKTQIGE